MSHTIQVLGAVYLTLAVVEYVARRRGSSILFLLP